ncbi:nuclear transport factor 2 family protein [Microbacterium jejuense]|uniref:Nuclear transport factor 2 family protein n=1 Tax=Microbacterium jejuense TaxID=1263637 RepID=A0ABS7HID9_9MICO|nr:nuclear transport factor 2 family protein [Microbacterium jejuense]MBW9092264.1 nuclear transport factor 2 family protein [Microbacterium jejuense]
MTERDQTLAAARAWLDGYLRAWESNDPDDIRAVFTPEAVYRYEPWTTAVTGQDAIVASWLDRRDEPGTYRFEGDVTAVDGRRAIVEGVTRYDSGTVYSNLWVIDLAEDRRAEAFTEWWMDQAHKS